MATTWIDELVPAELRLALGDLVIAAADLEGVAYDVAKVFRIERPESAPAKRALGMIQARAGVLRVPPWSNIELRKLLVWCRASSKMLEQRDRMIHARIHFKGGQPGAGEPEMVPARTSLRTGEPIEGDAEHVRAVVTYLLRMRRIGLIILHELYFPSPSGHGRMYPSYIPNNQLTHRPPVDIPEGWAHWITGADPIPHAETSADR